MNWSRKILAFALTLAITLSLVPGVYAENGAESVEHAHEYVAQVIKEASHEDKGLIRYTCSCEDFYEEETEALGHNYTAVYTEAVTCTEDGLTVYACSCGKSYKETTKAAGHDYVLESKKDSTCTEDGYLVYKCHCGDSYTVELPLAGHDYVISSTKHTTCTENGVTVYTCPCGDSYEEITPAYGHNHTVASVTKATCTKDGVTVYACSCGDSYSKVTAKAKGHKYKITEQTEPTQEEDGITVYTCSNCGDQYTTTQEHENKFVAKMYLCAKRQASLLGHMWIYIENRSNEPIVVGAYTVPVGQGVSIGTFGLTRADGTGIYYNVEAYSVNKYGLDSVICMQDFLTASDLENVSKKILRNNLWDPMIFNCMGVAFAIWNAGSSTTLVSFIFPFFGRLQMLRHPHTDEIEMYYPTEDQVYKQKGRGDKAKLETVSASTLAHGI